MSNRPRGNPNWVKGMPSSNPSGRSKREAELQLDIQEQARAWGSDAIATLAKLMKSGENDKVRVNAAQALLDRGYGKPHQTSSVDVTQNDVRRLGDAELDLAIAGALAREEGQKHRSGTTH